MLSDLKIKSLKKRDKVYRELDHDGLYIEIAVSGAKIWRHRYTLNKKSTMILIGHYPEVTLQEARRARDKNKQLLRQGVDPQKRKSQHIQPTFKAMFFKWHQHKKDEWSVGYANDVIRRAECYLLPFIGSKPINKITAPEMLKVLMNIEKKGILDTLKKIRGIASRVFTYSVGMGEITVNPVRDLPKDIFKKQKQKHYATITDPKKIGWLLRTLDCHQGSYQVRTALTLAPHVFLRPGELTKLTWSEVDFVEKIIRIDASKMKMKKAHLVPMSNQVFEILLELSYIETDSNFVFPSLKSKNKGITTNSLLVAIRSLGIGSDQFTTHGFRGMASSFLHEQGFNSDVIERQLAHSERNKVKAAYNHAEYLDKRRDMMQVWSNCLEDFKNQACKSRKG